MGINTNQRQFLNQHVFDHVCGRKMLELGAQWLNCPELGPEYPQRSFAKSYYTKEGWDHTSIDLKAHGGCLVKDLTVPGHFSDQTFDLITNHGTTEHISGKENQYKVFQNLHDWGKVGCVYAHCNPLEDSENMSHGLGRWHKHGWFGYSSRFWKKFVAECGYRLIYAGSDFGSPCGARRYSCASYIKEKKSKLLPLKDFLVLYKNVSCYNAGRNT